MLFQRVYTSRFGIGPEDFFVLSSVILFLSLIFVYSVRGIVRSILGGVAILLSLVLAMIPLQGPGPFWIWTVIYALVAAIYGFASGEDQFARKIRKLPKRVLLLEYEEHRQIFGALIEGSSLLMAGGGLGYVLSSTFQIPLWCAPLTCVPWINASLITLLTIGWGVYGVFILGYFLTMQSLKFRITS